MYGFRVRAVDGVGREGVSAAQTVVADRTAPTVTLALSESSPYAHISGGILYYGPYTGTYTVTATLADGTAGLAEVVFPATTGPGAAYALGGVTATARSHAYAFTAASDFSGTIPVTATDRATNARVGAFTVSRDATPPQVWLSAPAGVVTGPITVTWGATDAQAGVAWYDLDVSVDGGPWQRVLTRTLSTTHVHTCTLANFCTFRLTATDHVSNAASAVARTGVARMTKYYYHGGARVALRTSGAGGGVVYWLHSDHLGSVSLVTDHASRVVAQQRFLPYGSVRYSEGTFPTDVGFTGHRGHPALGLVYMRARYYHSGLGRFVSADKIVPASSSPQSFNRYAYVLNSPLRYRDPSGHTPIDICAATRGNAPGCGSGPIYAASTLVNFRGKWGLAYRVAVVGAAEDAAARMYEAIQADRQRAYAIAPRLGRDPAEYSAASHLWGLSQDELFLAAYGGQVTFRHVGGDTVCPGANCWAETHLDWANNLCNVGEICYDDSMFDTAPSEFQIKQNVGHELVGHGIDQRGGRQARADLAAAWDDLPLHRDDGGFAVGGGWQQSRGAGEGEVFADMGLGWTYDRWGDNAVGAIRDRYMEARMARYIALAVAGN